MHTSRHSRKNSSFSTQGEHLVLLGLEALTEASNLRSATRSGYQKLLDDVADKKSFYEGKIILKCCTKTLTKPHSH
jgi:hypothetical protein